MEQFIEALDKIFKKILKKKKKKKKVLLLSIIYGIYGSYSMI